MKIKFYNPFAGLHFNPFHEIRKSPYSRTLRTGFWQKMADTYFIFAGSFFDRRRKNHLGLFDYATFFIPYLAADLLINSPFPRSIEPVAALVLAFINLPFAVMRYGVAMVATAALSPFLLAVHGYALVRARKYKRNLYQLSGMSEPNKRPIQMNLGQLLKDRRLNLEEVGVSYTINENSDGKDQIVNFHQKAISGASAFAVCSCCRDEEKHILFSAKMNDQGEGFTALKKLNVGNFSGKLKKAGLFDSKEQETKEFESEGKGAQAQLN